MSDRAPDLIGEVVGWRAWELVGTKLMPRLRSVTTTDIGACGEGSIWPPGRWFQAVCPREDGHKAGEIPAAGCSCGIYSARDRDHLVKLNYGVYGHEYRERGKTTYDPARKVIGEVAYAGKVIPGSQGWKGERARVKSLVIPSEWWQWAAPLGRAYNVPVTTGFLFDQSVKERT